MVQDLSNYHVMREHSRHAKRSEFVLKADIKDRVSERDEKSNVVDMKIWITGAAAGCRCGSAPISAFNGKSEAEAFSIAVQNSDWLKIPSATVAERCRPRLGHQLSWSWRGSETKQLQPGS